MKSATRQPASAPMDENHAREDQPPGAGIAEALCDRIRQLAESSAAQAIDAARAKSEALLADAAATAEAEYQARLSDAKQHMAKQLGRQLQNARLEARARRDVFCWDALTRVLDEAEQAVRWRRHNDPDRYYSALVQLVQSACRELAAENAPEGVPSIIVEANAADIDLLRKRLHQEGIQVELVESDIAAGAVVSAPGGNSLVDHSVARRRQRLEPELRLAARDVLFEEPASEKRAAETL